MSKWEIVETAFWCALVIPLGIGLGLWILKEVFDFDLIATMRRRGR